MKKVLILVILLISTLSAIAYPFNYETCNLGYKHVHHKHNEASYQQAWCYAHNGIIEYENSDLTRVDCLTKTHAVEFDFANKWAESIGQALYYASSTGKEAGIVLIIENPEKDLKYLKRLKNVTEKYNIKVWTITPEDVAAVSNCEN